VIVNLGDHHQRSASPRAITLARVRRETPRTPAQ
jgi:hypothetical protein